MKHIRTALTGAAALLVIGLNTIIFSTLVCIGGLFRFVAPTTNSRAQVRHWVAGLVELWVIINNGVFALLRQTRWDIQIPQQLDYRGCYLVSCNHQSWVDILVLQRCFNRRLPLLRFFLKKELFWVPFLGLAWWSLDFPFLQRYSKAQIASNPGLRGKDLENARKVCEKFREIPVAMMSFPEGTRFSEQKRQESHSPYQSLLKPRIGGIGQVLYALGDQLDGLIDVTIVYPGARADAAPPTFWELVSGQIPKIVVRAQQREIPAELRGREFGADGTFRSELQAWINQQWLEKDAAIQLLNKGM